MGNNQMSKEIRSLPVALQIRAAGTGEGKSVSGSILYDTPSAVMRDWLGDEFQEILAPGCFDDSLENRDVIALWSHKTEQVLGNTKSKTLRVDSSEKELSFEIDLPDTTAGNDAAESIRRGDVDGVSFGMIVNKDKWANDDGVYVRTILEAELWEISPVAFPAFPQNEVKVRGLEEFKKELESMGKEKKDVVEQVAEEKETERREEEKVEKTIPAVARTIDSKVEQRAAFNHFLRTGEMRDALLVGGDGGALAPQDFAKEIIDGLNDEVVMRRIARILPPISGKSAAYPRRTSGASAAMVAEGQEIVPGDIKFEQVTLTPKKAASIVEVSNELLADEGVDLAGYLSQHFQDEIGELLEGQYWTGDGNSPNLQGVLDGIDSTDAEEVTADAVLGLWASLPAQYRHNATFVASSAVETQLRKLQDGNGQYLLVPNMAEALKDTLLGRPLVVTEVIGNALVVGDFVHGVFIADKAGIDIQRNDSVGFYKDTTAFRAIFRTDIVLAWADALRVLTFNS